MSSSSTSDGLRLTLPATTRDPDAAVVAIAALIHSIGHIEVIPTKLIRCDTCGADFTHDGADTFAALRQHATDHGWRCGSTADTCPGCASPAPTSTPKGPDHDLD